MNAIIASPVAQTDGYLADTLLATKRSYCLRYSANIPEDQAFAIIDSWNAILGRLPCDEAEIYFSKDPEIELLEEGEFVVYSLYANDKAWELFHELASCSDVNEDSSGGVFSDCITLS